MSHTKKASQSGIIAPTTVLPEFIGQVYQDTVANKTYIANSLTLGDWEEVGGGGASPVYSNMVFVDVTGSDTTGDGTVSNPYASLYKAMTSIVDATPTKRYAIKMGVGFWTETQNIVHKPNVWIMGQNAYSTRVILSGVYSLDASFAGAADNRFGFESIYIDGILTVDMDAVSASSSRMYNRNCQFNKAISFKANTATSRFYLFNCETFSTTGASGGYVHLINSIFNGLVTLSSKALTSCTHIMTGSYFPNGLTIAQTSGTDYIDAWLYSSQVRNTLTVSGAAGLHYGLGCLPPPYSRVFSSTAVINCQGMDDITRINHVRKVVSTTSYYINGNDDYLIGVDTSAIAITVIMPNTSFYDGYSPITIKDETGNASVNPITINRSGSVDTFEGATSLTINTNYGSVKLYKAGVGKWCKL